MLLGLDRNKCIPDGTDGIQRTKAKDDAICTSFPESQFHTILNGIASYCICALFPKILGQLHSFQFSGIRRCDAHELVDIGHDHRYGEEYL